MQEKNRSVYFATEADGAIVGRLVEKIEQYYEFLLAFGYAQKVLKSMAYYAGGTLDDGKVSWRISRGGDVGEVLFNFENHYRAIAQSMLNLTTAQRPSVQPMAKTSDKSAISNAAVTKAVIDYNLTEAGLEDMLRRAVEKAIHSAEGHIFVDWDASKGDEVGALNPITGEAEQRPTGDVRFRLYHMFDVVRDPYAPSWKDCSWKILRNFVNKFELAALYPEVADQIISAGARANDEETRAVYETRAERSDLIPLWEFYHEKTPAVPNGRYVKFIRGLFLEGGPLPTKKIQLYRVSPSELEGTPFGYTSMFDLLGAQETINGLDTAMTTNQLGHGVGNLLVPRGANISVEQFATSMNAITYDGQNKPEPLQFTSTPREYFDYKKDKIAAMEVMSGVNSVVRGNPSENVGADASGSKLALLSATAIQQNSGLEREYVQLIRNVSLGIVGLYKARGGNVERTVRIVGKFNKYQVKDFTSQTFSDIDSVDVDIGNPVTRQISGRMALGDRLIELGIIKPENMNAYITLVQQGTIEPMIQGEQAQMARIEEENENMIDGLARHRALITDPHWIEIPKHLELLDNPDMRTPEMQQAAEMVLNAVQEHIQMFRAMPPELVALRGGQNALQIWQLMMGMQPGQPVNTPSNEGNETNPPASDQENLAHESISAAPTQPRMPTNPATGEQASLPGVEDQ